MRLGDLVYRGVVELEVALWRLGRPRSDWLRRRLVSPVSCWFEGRGAKTGIPTDEDLPLVRVPAGGWGPDGPTRPGDRWLAVNRRTNELVRVEAVAVDPEAEAEENGMGC